MINHLDMHNRIVWLDVMKGIFILFVLLSRSSEIGKTKHLLIPLIAMGGMNK